MRKISPPDYHHLNAMHGWLELGNPAEARVELGKISARLHQHPEVLEAVWQLNAAEKHWEQALEAARALIVAMPDAAAGWIGQSFSLHELKRTQEAYDLLVPVSDKFPDIHTIPYNLACYACQSGDFVLARRWLQRAVKIKNKEEIQKMAVEDADLAPMWSEIKGW